MKVKLCLTTILAACLLGACDLIYEDTASQDGDISNYYKPGENNSPAQAGQGDQENLVADQAPGQDDQADVRYEDLVGRYYYTDGRTDESGFELKTDRVLRQGVGQYMTDIIQTNSSSGSTIMLETEGYNPYEDKMTGNYRSYQIEALDADALDQLVNINGDILMRGPELVDSQKIRALYKSDLVFGTFITSWGNHAAYIDIGTNASSNGHLNDLALYLSHSSKKPIMYTLYDFNGDGVDEVVFRLGDKVFEIYMRSPEGGYQRLFGDDTLAERSSLTWLANNQFLVHGSGGASIGGYDLYEIQGHELVQLGSYDYDYTIKDDGSPINQSGILTQEYVEELKSAPQFPLGSLAWINIPSNDDL